MTVGTPTPGVEYERRSGGFPPAMNWLAHRRMRRAVSAYLDGELDAAAAAAVSAHLRECWACSGDAELMRMVKQSLRNLAGRHADVLAVMRLRRSTRAAE